MEPQSQILIDQVAHQALLDEQQNQRFDIDNYYNNIIVTYGDCFFDKDAITKEDTIYGQDEFNDFIDEIKVKIFPLFLDLDTTIPNIDKICNTVKETYASILIIEDENIKQKELTALKNSLLLKLELDQIFIDKCSQDNVAKITARHLEFAKYLSLQQEEGNSQVDQLPVNINNKEDFIKFCSKKTVIKSSTGEVLSEIYYILDENQEDKYYQEIQKEEINLIQEDIILNYQKEPYQENFVNLDQQDASEFMRKIFEISEIDEKIKIGENEYIILPDISPQDIKSTSQLNSFVSKRRIFRGNRNEVIATFDFCLLENGTEAVSFQEILNEEKYFELISQENYRYEEKVEKIAYSNKNYPPKFFAIPIKRALSDVEKDCSPIDFRANLVVENQSFIPTDIIIHNGSAGHGHYYTISRRMVDGVEKLFRYDDNSSTIIENEDNQLAKFSDIVLNDLIKENVVNIFYQTEIPVLNQQYKGLPNNSSICYMNAVFSVISGILDITEKNKILKKLEHIGIKFDNDGLKANEGAVDRLKSIFVQSSNDESLIIPKFLFAEEQSFNNKRKNFDEEKELPIIQNHFSKELEFVDNLIPSNEVQPSFFGKFCDFLKSLNPFSCCDGSFFR